MCIPTCGNVHSDLHSLKWNYKSGKVKQLFMKATGCIRCCADPLAEVQNFLCIHMSRSASTMSSCIIPLQALITHREFLKLKSKNKCKSTQIFKSMKDEWHDPHHSPNLILVLKVESYFRGVCG